MMDDMGYQSMMNYGIGYGGILTGLLVLLVKFLFVVLIISIIAVAVIWLKNNIFKDINIPRMMNQNPLIKTIIGISAVILCLLFLIYLFNLLTGNMMGNGMSYGVSYDAGSGYMNGYYGYGSNFSLSGIIIFILKALLCVFVITLVISIVAYVVKQLGFQDFNFFKASKNMWNQDTTMNHTNSQNQQETSTDSEGIKNQNGIEE